jgi:predicted  nucleic acid-binding Zn-ribbon protein
VVPGVYSVELAVNTDTVAVPFEVVIDPRVTASQEDLLAQYDFLQDIRSTMERINATISEIRQVRNRLDALKKTVQDSSLNEMITSISDKGAKIEETLYQTKNQSPQDPLNFPIRLNNKYGHLGSLADVGFNRPTSQMYEVKEELENQIFEQIETWDILKGEIKDLNRALHEAKVPYIETD